jgi:autotransporter-associated beta strand protein
MNRAFTIALLLVVAVAAIAPTSQAATTRHWNVATGEFATLTNWNPSTPAWAAGDIPYIDNNGTATYSTSVGVSLAAVYLGEGGKTGTMSMTAGTLTSTSYLYLGGADTTNNSKGYWNQSGGTASFGTTVRLAYKSGDYGEINLSGTGTFSTDYNIAMAYTGGIGKITQTGGTLESTRTNTSAGAYYVGYQGIGIVEQSGGAVNLGKTASGTGTRDLDVGGYAASTGTTAYGYYKLSGGTITLRYNDDTYVGHFSYGIMEQSAGTHTVGSILWIGGTYSTSPTNSPDAFGVYNLSGGTARSQYYVSSSKSGIGGGGGTGVFNVTGTGSFTCNSVQADDMFAVGGYTNADTAILNLGAIDTGGGTFSSKTAVRRMNLATTGTSLVNFHGGTLRALNNGVSGSTGPTGAESFLNGTTTYVYAEGAKIDTNSQDITIDNALLAPSAGQGVSTTFNIAGSGGAGYLAPPVVKITGGGGVGATAIAKLKTDGSGSVDQIILTNPGTGYTEPPTVTLASPTGLYTTPATATAALNGGNDLSGGLTKSGLGTLTLSGMSNYQGVTKVEAGTLKLTGSLESSLVEVQASATLMGTGSLLAGGDVSVAAGAFLKPGSSIGTFTVTGDATIGGTLDVEYDSTAETIDMLAVSGKLDLTGATINFTDLAPEKLDQWTYVFATYGTLVGAPAVEVGVPTGYHVDYAYNGNSIALIPEPSMVILLGLAALALLGFRSRR